MAVRRIAGVVGQVVRRVGRGYAVALAARTRAGGPRAGGAARLLVVVETASGAAYAAAGFDAEARIRDWYASGEDKVLFRRALA